MPPSKDGSSSAARRLFVQVNCLPVLSCLRVNLCLKAGGEWAEPGSLSPLPPNLLSYGTTSADRNQGPHVTPVIGMKGKTHSLFTLCKSTYDNHGSKSDFKNTPK